MKPFTLLLISLVLITTACTSVQARDSEETPGERIEFEPDATSATRRGTLSEGEIKEYVLAARDGQTITIDITSVGVPVSLNISSPSGKQLFTEVNQASPTDGDYRAGYSFTLAETGDYIVTLAKAEQTPSTNYTVDFTVQ